MLKKCYHSCQIKEVCGELVILFFTKVLSHCLHVNCKLFLQTCCCISVSSSHAVLFFFYLVAVRLHAYLVKAEQNMSLKPCLLLLVEFLWCPTMSDYYRNVDKSPLSQICLKNGKGDISTILWVGKVICEG